MKISILHRMVAVALAVYMICIGGGVDVYHYCCDACRSYGHDIYKTITCDEVHSLHECTDADCGHHHHHAEPITDADELCFHLTQSAKHCDVHHFSAPQLAQSVEVDMVPHVLLTAVLTDYVDFTAVSTDVTVGSAFSFIDIPPILGGRAIIVLKNSYLI